MYSILCYEILNIIHSSLIYESLLLAGVFVVLSQVGREVIGWQRILNSTVIRRLFRWVVYVLATAHFFARNLPQWDCLQTLESFFSISVHQELVILWLFDTHFIWRVYFSRTFLQRTKITIEYHGNHNRMEFHCINSYI